MKRVSTAIDMGIQFLSNTSYSSNLINTAYQTPLDNAYRSLCITDRCISISSDQEYLEDEDAEARAETGSNNEQTRMDYGSRVVGLNDNEEGDQKGGMKKVYASQVGCEQCKGPHYTKDCPLKEEGKTLEEAYYMQFGGPFQGGGYRAIAPGYYQRNNANPSYQERRQSLEDTLSKFMSELAKRHEENSNLIKEI
ncbi:retrovirus-related pol polyprotein from transposon TNT 1-94 [Tanacetum coccineum]